MKIDTAVVLAGGPGMRLRPVTERLPKALVKVYRKPLLQWVIEWLRDNDVKEIVLGVAHLKEKIIDYFGDGTNFDVNLRYSVHTIDGGTCEGFRLAIKRHIKKDVFFALNGDQITDLDLSDLGSFHEENNPTVTIVVTRPSCPFGHIQVNDQNEATEFLEKPPCPVAMCSAGIYVFNREIFDCLPKKGDVEDSTFPRLARERRLKVYPFNGFFVTVNTPKDLIEVENQLRRRITS